LEIRRKAGPFTFVAADALVLKVRDWKPISDPLNCINQRFGVNYERDVVAFAVPRGCLARAVDMPVRKLRVAVQTAQNRVDGGTPRIDWAPKRHMLFSAVPRG
jgi:hypothetical protein